VKFTLIHFCGLPLNTQIARWHCVLLDQAEKTQSGQGFAVTVTSAFCRNVGLAPAILTFGLKRRAPHP
jgi:hypothetical protein